MKRHRHSTVLECHASSGVVSYIDLNRPELLEQQRHVVDVIETIGYRGAVSSVKREGPQHRCYAVADDARLHNVRVDVDGIEPLIHVDRIIAFSMEGVRSIRTVCRWHNPGGRWCDTDIRST